MKASLKVPHVLCVVHCSSPVRTVLWFKALALDRGGGKEWTMWIRSPSRMGYEYIKYSSIHDPCNPPQSCTPMVMKPILCTMTDGYYLKVCVRTWTWPLWGWTIAVWIWIRRGYEYNLHMMAIWACIDNADVANRLDWEEPGTGTWNWPIRIVHEFDAVVRLIWTQAEFNNKTENLGLIRI